MSLFNFFSPRPPPSGLLEWHGEEFSLDDPRVPEEIRQRIREDFGEGFQLFYTHTRDGGEWRLIDGDELLEAYWLE